MGDIQEDTADLVQLVRSGDQEGLNTLFRRHEGKLLKMIELRMDPRVRAKADPADVLQDARLEALRRLEEYLSAPKLPFFLWIRFITRQKLLELHRKYFDVAGRDVRREVAGVWTGFDDSSSANLTAFIVAHQPSPGSDAALKELRESVLQAIEALSPIDREVLSLRHYEGLANVEVAQELGIEERTASQRYLRALERLGRALKKSAPGAL